MGNNTATMMGHEGVRAVPAMRQHWFRRGQLWVEGFVWCPQLTKLLSDQGETRERFMGKAGSVGQYWGGDCYHRQVR